MKLEENCEYLIRGTNTWNSQIEKIKVKSITKKCYEIEWSDRYTWELIEDFKEEYYIIEKLD